MIGGMSIPIYLGSILLEPNRWQNPKVPSFSLSDWIPQIAASDFDGLELWEPHDLAASDVERKMLRSGAPIKIWNSYYLPHQARPEEWKTVLDGAIHFGAHGIKFNWSGKAEDWDGCLAGTRQWLRELPTSVTLLCECHEGSLLETPEATLRAIDQLGDDAEQLGIIVHPFAISEEALRDWLEKLGERIVHLHAQARLSTEGRPFVTVAEAQESINRASAILREYNFQGTCTLEFTGGIGTSTDTPEGNWEQALKDLKILREALQASS